MSAASGNTSAAMAMALTSCRDRLTLRRGRGAGGARYEGSQATADEAGNEADDKVGGDRGEDISHQEGRHAGRMAVRELRPVVAAAAQDRQGGQGQQDPAGVDNDTADQSAEDILMPDTRQQCGP